MMDLVKEAQESRKKIILSAMVVGLALLAAVPLVVVSGVLLMETWLRFTLIGIGLLVIAGGIAIACVMDREAGAFECPVCHERFVPGMQEYVMGAHTLTKRRMRCPKCGAVRYCRHVLTRKQA